MPTADTTECQPIAEVVGRYATGTVVDPFARTAHGQELQQRLEPGDGGEDTWTPASSCEMLVRDGVQADCVVSIRLSVRARLRSPADSVGMKMGFADGCVHPLEA